MLKTALTMAMVLNLGIQVTDWSNRSTYIPPPLRVHVPFEAAWRGMNEVLKERKLPLVHQDRGRGVVVTTYREYISGPLAESHIRKIARPPKLTDASWVSVEYQFEILIELVEAKETIVTVNANIRGLKRDFFGREAWIEVHTNGNREEDLLADFGRLLFGQTFSLESPKKGFWERDPEYVPDMLERIPRIPGPERP